MDAPRTVLDGREVEVERVGRFAGKAGAQQPANRLYRNLGGKGSVNILPAGSALNVADHGVQWVDYDRDGRLDLIVTLDGHRYDLT